MNQITDTQKIRHSPASWFRLAAEQGHATAQNNTGEMYDNGFGVAEDDAEAAKWYRLSAEQGNVDAQSNLGWMYAYGLGIPLDSAKAHMWFDIAAMGGNDWAVARRTNVAKRMDVQDIVTAEERAMDCIALDFKGC